MSAGTVLPTEERLDEMKMTSAALLDPVSAAMSPTLRVRTGRVDQLEYLWSSSPLWSLDLQADLCERI